jgi:hypothetical protein
MLGDGWRDSRGGQPETFKDLLCGQSVLPIC